MAFKIAFSFSQFVFMEFLRALTRVCILHYLPITKVLGYFMVTIELSDKYKTFEFFRLHVYNLMLFFHYKHRQGHFIIKK